MEAIIDATLDWERVASQLLRALRGKRSQRALSRRLGYRSNPVADWEVGRRFPTAAQALLACGRLGIDVAAAFERFHPQSAQALGAADAPEVGAWLDVLRGGASIVEVAERAGRSRFAVARWLHGQAEPRLPDFLRLVDAISGRASDLVAELVDIDAVPELASRHRLRRALKGLAFEAPWTEAILRVMETEDYRALPRHPPGYLARRLRIGVGEEARALALSEAAGVLALEGGRYRDLTPLTVDMSAAPAQINQLKAHWTRAALDRLQAPLERDWLGYNVISVSDADLERIRALLSQVFREIRTIAAASQPVQSAALINLQLVAFDEPAGQ